VVCSTHHDIRLLLADDDDGFRETVCEVLEPYFETIAVSSGEEAIEVVERHVVHVALFDMHMHAMNGVETVRVAKRIRAELPCILITSDVTDYLRQQARLARVFRVLSKPPAQRELLSTIDAALRDASTAAGGRYAESTGGASGTRSDYGVSGTQSESDVSDSAEPDDFFGHE
jgi:CheY-like chemotaxis protein